VSSRVREWARSSRFRYRRSPSLCQVREPFSTRIGDAQLATQRRGDEPVGIIAWIIVGAIAGYLAGMLVRGDEGLGVIGHIVLGIVGALVGGFLAGLVTGGNDYITGINISTIVVAIIGAVIVVVIWNAIAGRSRVGSGPV
jgi:uncharacterized membrane protein YeaQ/YmgE (transglycosylase-associated protein family)